MPFYLHITFNFHRGENKIDELIPTFNKALEWCRYAPNCWVVWTTSPPDDWYARLKPHLADYDHLFISALDLRNGYTGFLPQWAWDWLAKDR